MFNNKTDAVVASVTFAGLKGSDSLSPSDYTATAQFSDPNAGNDKIVEGTVTLKDSVNNYKLEDGANKFTLTNQNIVKAFVLAPQPQSQVVYLSYGAAGPKQIRLNMGLMENHGSTTGNVRGIRDFDQILSKNTVKLNGEVLTVYLAENDKK